MNQQKLVLAPLDDLDQHLHRLVVLRLQLVTRMTVLQTIVMTTSFQAPDCTDLNRALAEDPESNAPTRPLLAALRLNRFGCMWLLGTSLGPYRG